MPLEATAEHVENYIQNNHGDGVILSGQGNYQNGVLGNNISNNQGNGIVVANHAQENGIRCNTIALNNESGVLVIQPDTSGNYIGENVIGFDPNLYKSIIA